jgi:hypothetical protein
VASSISTTSCLAKGNSASVALPRITLEGWPECKAAVAVQIGTLNAELESNLGKVPVRSGSPVQIDQWQSSKNDWHEVFPFAIETVESRAVADRSEIGKEAILSPGPESRTALC